MVMRGRSAFGERNGLSRITEAQALAIRRMRRQGHSRREVAEALDVPIHTVADVATGRSWKYAGEAVMGS